MKAYVFSFISSYFCFIKAHYCLIYIKVSHNSKHLDDVKLVYDNVCKQDTEHCTQSFPQKKKNFIAKFPFSLFYFLFSSYSFQWYLYTFLRKKISERQFPWKKNNCAFHRSVYCLFFFYIHFAHIGVKS